MLESVGLGVLRKNNLLPNPENSIKCKDVYEAFLRFDDKPMIVGAEAVNRSLSRYCLNNEFGIASGDGNTFTNYFIGKEVPYFDTTDSTYWLVDKSIIPNEKPAENKTQPIEKPKIDTIIDSKPTHPIVTDKIINTITISGKVPMEQWTQLFPSFIQTLSQNNIEIEIRIKGKSTDVKPINENSQEYKIIKESAKQLGLNLEEN